MFRRDQNFWNYNHFSNPFNPTVISPTNPATNPSFAVTSSPHALTRIKRMPGLQFDTPSSITLRFRVGYSHNVDVGCIQHIQCPAARYLLAENYRITMNGYRLGMDFRFSPKDHDFLRPDF